MGYDVHITRKQSWSDEEGPSIQLQEWLDYVASDQELSRDPQNSDHAFLFTRGSFTAPLWWSNDRGDLHTKWPDDVTIEKMVEIAKQLKARVIGDEGEEYPLAVDNVTNIKAAAQWASDALTENGYQADFRPASLWEIDRFLDEHWSAGAPIAGNLLGQDVDTFAVASYVGEVIRRTLGGKWHAQTQESSVKSKPKLMVRDAILSLVDIVEDRLRSGSESRIGAYGTLLGLDVGSDPKARRSRQHPWWKLW